MSTPTIRAALERLVEIDRTQSIDWAWEHENAIAAARAALAEPVGEGPPAVTTSALLHPAYEPGDGSADGAQIVDGEWWQPVFGCDSLQIVVNNARAALAHLGHPAAPPAPAPVMGDRPSDEELYDLADEFAGDPVPSMRAALARWGSPATPPAPLTDLAARLISESKPMDPEIAEALTPEARWDLYEPAASPAPKVGEVASVARCARIELVTAIHCLASHLEIACSDLSGDDLRKAKNDIAHARRIAAKHNQNGPGCPQFPTAAPAAPEVGEVGKIAA